MRIYELLIPRFLYPDFVFFNDLFRFYWKQVVSCLYLEELRSISEIGFSVLTFHFTIMLVIE